MQTTAAAFDAEKSKRDGSKPVLLLDLELSGETLRLSNRSVQIAGTYYGDRIQEGVDVVLDGSFTPDGGGSPRVSSVPIVIQNGDDGVAPWSDIFAARTVLNRRAVLRQGYLDAAGVPLAIADSLTLVDGTIRTPDDDLFDETACNLEIADGSPAWHKSLGTPITAADFPNAPTNVLGRIQPIGYGSIAKHQCIPVDVGARTTLAEDVTITSTVIDLTDLTGFPSAGTLYIDGDEIAYTGKTPTLWNNVAVGTSPVGIAMHPAGTAVYVANSGQNTVFVINPVTDAVTGTVAVGTGPRNLAVHPAGTRVYVSNQTSNSVSVVNTATGTVAATVAVGTSPLGIAVHPAGTAVYVANFTNNNIFVLDTATNAVTGTVAVGTGPYDVAVHPAGTAVYVANATSNTVSVINPATGTVVATVAVGTGPEALAVHPAGTAVYVANFTSNSVSVINPATGTVAATVAVGTGPYAVAVHPAGTAVYVINSTSDSVSVIDPATNAVTATVAVAVYPVGVAVDPAGRMVYIVNNSINHVYILDTAAEVLTGVSGIDASHSRGAAVVEKQAHYDYLAFDDAISAINNVYIRRRGGGDEDWTRVGTDEYTAYATGGGGFAGKANIRFSGATFLQHAADIYSAGVSHSHGGGGTTGTACHEHITDPALPLLITNSWQNCYYTNVPLAGYAGTHTIVLGTTINGTWRLVRQDQTILGTLGTGTTAIADPAPSGIYYVARVSGGYCTLISMSRDITVAGGAVAFSGVTGVTVTGQQVAEAIYDLDVAADVECYADDDTGSYTGTASSLVIRPSDILRHIAGVRLGWTVADRFGTATFDAARALEGTNGMRMDFAITREIDSAELFERIRHQSMSAQFLDASGRYQRHVHPFAGTSVVTFAEGTNLAAPIRVRITPLDDIYNVVGVRYAPDPWTGVATGYTEATGTASQGTGNPPTPGYNVTRRWLQDFDLIRDATAAAWARDAWLTWLQDQHYLVDLVASPEWIHLEPWDRIAVTSTRMPGDWTAKAFLIQSVRKSLGRPADEASSDRDDRILLTCREA
jgi:YVTN family beta-propeller protein